LLSTGVILINIVGWGRAPPISISSVETCLDDRRVRNTRLALSEVEGYERRIRCCSITIGRNLRLAFDIEFISTNITLIFNLGFHPPRTAGTLIRLSPIHTHQSRVQVVHALVLQV
jgi:hypothetical protein